MYTKLPEFTPFNRTESTKKRYSIGQHESIEYSFRHECLHTQGMVNTLKDSKCSMPTKRQRQVRDEHRADMTPVLLRLLINEAQANGPRPELLLRGSGLEPADMNSPHLRISYRQYAEVVRRFLAVRPALHTGLLLASRVNVLALGKVALGMLASSDHHEMLDFLVEFQRMAGFAMALSLQRSLPLQQIQVEVTPRFDDPDIEPFLTLFTVAALNQITRQVLGTNFQAVRILLALPRPPDAYEYELALGCRVSFGARTSMLCLPLAPLEIAASEPSVVERMRELLCASNALPSFEHGAAVMQIIRRCQAAAPPLAQIATELNISERTLRRKLREEGLTYRGLINEHRRQRTIALLVQSSTPMTEIATQTGYSSPRSLRRAVNRWTGIGPSSVRRNVSTSSPEGPDPARATQGGGAKAASRARPARNSDSGDIT